MRKRSRIGVSLVEKYYDDVCFLVDTDYTYVQAIISRVAWLRPLPYEVIIDEITTTITALLAEEVDKSDKVFGKYEEAKTQITFNLKIATLERKIKNMMKNLKRHWVKMKNKIHH